MSRYILAIDQGTTGTTVMVLDPKLSVVARSNREFPQVYPRPGWVEHDPEAIWTSTLSTIDETLKKAGIQGADLAGIGITNQRETTVLWRRRDDRPIHNAIVWQCRRTAPLCAELKENGLESLFRSKTGLVLDPYFSGTKIRWILDEVEGARQAATNGDLAFGTIDSFLTWRLSGGKSHVTDVSNASRTLLMDLETLSWDDELLDQLQVPRSLLPRICSSSEVYGHTSGVPNLPDGIPIAGIAGDQQAALFGQVCFSPGEAKCTFGTGAFLLMNTGARPVPSERGLLTTVAWRIGDEVSYALEGSAFIAGAAVQWLRDGLGIIRDASEIEALARSVNNSGGVVFVPALTGLGAPHWRAEARGIICGIDRGVTRAHLARAALEGIALQNADILSAMEADSGVKLSKLKVDGGAAANDLLVQYQADVLNVPIVRPKMLETTALGAGLLAGLATGMWSSRSEAADVWASERQFVPNMESSTREQELARWRDAVSRA
ncbi:MAG: glycerol kinase [Rickettsiales bacterium]|nr:glycerol kinase [Rickettsiales bacterium]|tara:strand:+ start:2756 stop:4234 length:1479 start_codon:yes stop_codon:yes gene_type:complete